MQAVLATQDGQPDTVLHSSVPVPAALQRVWPRVQTGTAGHEHGGRVPAVALVASHTSEPAQAAVAQKRQLLKSAVHTS